MASFLHTDLAFWELIDSVIVLIDEEFCCLKEMNIKSIVGSIRRKQAGCTGKGEGARTPGFSFRSCH